LVLSMLWSVSVFKTSHFFLLKDFLFLFYNIFL
jgi:hypothetical protein